MGLLECKQFIKMNLREFGIDSSKKKVNALFRQWARREVERLLANICYEIKPNL